jgi:hypothetical protein
MQSFDRQISASNAYPALEEDEVVAEMDVVWHTELEGRL